MKEAIKKVAAIHDLSCHGKSSLSVVTPILSSFKAQVSPLPTSLLSTHTDYPNFHFTDLSEQMISIIDHWKKLKLKFNAIYTGFLGHPLQIKIIQNFINFFKMDHQLILIDPVLGDDGRLYPTFGIEMVNAMKKLIQSANIITPNITEAALLLDQQINSFVDKDIARKWAKQLADKGPQMVIITSVPQKEDTYKKYVLAYDKSIDQIWEIPVNHLPAHFSGTGDAFASVVLGNLLTGHSLLTSLKKAVNFTSLGVSSAIKNRADHKEGIVIEPILESLHLPV